jgi:tetratricopeptide (TPR) repeat protein
MKYASRSLIAMITLMFLLFTDMVSSSYAERQSMAARATAALNAVRKLDNPDVNEVTNLILQGKYKEFEKRSKYYERKFLKDPLYESPLVKLYCALDYRNSLLLEKLDKWVKNRPSYISYGARGVYKVNRGYFIRGKKYISETPPENILKMELIHEEARSDLESAINENKRFAPAYCALMQIEEASGNIGGLKSILDDAIRSIPETYYIRYTYLTALHPRWGGSYELMQEYASGISKEALINPRIWSLKGEVPAERGYTALLNKDYNKAIQYYTEALSYGERMSFLKYRGRMFMKVKKYDMALQDFMRYTKYDESDKEVNDYIKYLNGILKGNRSRY